jgi:hypothetical protein
MTSGAITPAPRLTVRQGVSTNPDAALAVQELAAQIRQPESGLNLAFFSDAYDRDTLGHALQRHLPGPLIGCTTAGQLSPLGFQRGGISGASLASEFLQAVPYLIHPLSNLATQAENIAVDVQRRLQAAKLQAFGLLLADGLAGREELLAASLYRALGDVPIIGGSAGDMLHFKETFVYHDGRLLQDAAVFTLCLTSLPFSVFKHQHFLPTGNRLVITEADTERRLVHEINGEPAMTAYARLVNVPLDQLSAAVFSRHPLMLRIDDDYYVRSIAGVAPDGGLKFHCAIDKGLVLTIGEGHSPVESLQDAFARVRSDIGEPAVILGCDCVLRRLEMEALNIDDSIGRLMSLNKVVGFSTYGEQFHSLHVNQTFTGVAIAR